MIEYSVKHHVPGRIRVSVPGLKNLPADKLEKLASAVKPSPPGIQDVSANPVTGSLIVKYDPKSINILEYIKTIALDENIMAIVEG